MRLTRRDFMRLLGASGLREVARLFMDDQVDQCGQVFGEIVGVSRETCVGVVSVQRGHGWTCSDDEPCSACAQHAGADCWIDMVERRPADDLAGCIVAFDLAPGWEKSISVVRFVPSDSENEIGVECELNLSVLLSRLRAIDQDDGEWVTDDQGETWRRVL